MKKKKIFFLVPSLRLGGSENFIITLVSSLDKSKFDISVLLVNTTDSRVIKLPNHIDLIDLGSSRVRYSIFKILTYVYRRKPDILFSTVSHLNLYVSILKYFLPRGMRVIARETNTLSNRYLDQSYPLLFKYLYKIFYNNIDTFVAQSRHMANDLESFNVVGSKIEVIYNPVDVEKIKTLSKEPCIEYKRDCIRLLSVGSLVYQKGHDILLRALAAVDLDFHLIVLGDGHLRSDLIALSEKLGLKNKVDFLGQDQNPYRFMECADYLILSSRYEGLPNVVLESHACGLPVICLNSPGGVSEIITDKENGIMLDEFSPFTLTLTFNDAYLNEFCRKRISKTVNQYFDISKIMPIYEKLFLLDQ